VRITYVVGMEINSSLLNNMLFEKEKENIAKHAE
jgi:hypothetical protein